MKVLLAVDDRDHGKLMTDFIARHYWPEDIKFTILNVIEPILLDHSGDIAFVRFLEASAEQILKEGSLLVSEIATAIKKSCPNAVINEQVLEGHVVSKVLDTANFWKPDMMIVGSHGRTGLNRFVMGSVSESLMAHAPCSLIVLRLPSPQKSESRRQNKAPAVLAKSEK